MSDRVIRQLLSHGWRRAWINQPSTLQRYHRWHGEDVLAIRVDRPGYEHYDQIIWLTRDCKCTDPTWVERLALSNRV